MGGGKKRKNCWPTLTPNSGSATRGSNREYRCTLASTNAVDLPLPPNDPGPLPPSLPQVLRWFVENGVCSDDPDLQRARRRRFHSRGGGKAQSGAPTKSSNTSGGGGSGGGGGGSNGGSSDGASSGRGNRFRSGDGGGDGGSNLFAAAAAPAHGSFPPAVVPTGGGDGTSAARQQQEEKEEPAVATAPMVQSNGLPTSAPPVASGVSINRRSNGELRRQSSGRLRRRPGGPVKAAARVPTTRLAKLPFLQQILPLQPRRDGNFRDGECATEGARTSGWCRVSGLGGRRGSRRGPPAGNILMATPAVEDAAANAGHLEV